MVNKDERKFIHDLANTLGIVVFALEMYLENIKDREASLPEDLDLTKMIFGELETVKAKLQARRSILIEQEGSQAEPDSRR